MDLEDFVLDDLEIQEEDSIDLTELDFENLEELEEGSEVFFSEASFDDSAIIDNLAIIDTDLKLLIVILLAFITFYVFRAFRNKLSKEG